MSAPAAPSLTGWPGSSRASLPGAFRTTASSDMRSPLDATADFDPTGIGPDSPGEVLQADLAAGDQPILLVTHLDLPELLAAAAMHGGGARDDPRAFGHRAQEVRVVGDADHLAPLTEPEGGPDARAGLGGRAVHATVGDAVRLQVLRSGRPAQDDPVRPGLVEMEPEYLGQPHVDACGNALGEILDVGHQRTVSRLVRCGGREAPRCDQPSSARVTESSARARGSCRTYQRAKVTGAASMTTVDCPTVSSIHQSPKGRLNTFSGVTQ